MKVMAHEDESLTGEFDDKILVLKRRYVKVIMDLIGELQEQDGGKGIDLRRGDIFAVRHDELDLYLVSAQARSAVSAD